MSGICAVWRKDDPRSSGHTLAQMTPGLRVVAPERVTTKQEGAVALGVSSRFGSEQIYGNGRVTLACDADLCRENELIEAAGGFAADQPEQQTAALLLRLYERFGCDFVGRLRGAFSVILWDSTEHILLAAVDGFGIKRLAYYHDSEKVMVATRIGALAAAGEVAPAVNPRAIANILNFTTSLGPETVLANVSRVLPGEMLVASMTGVRTRRYWDMRYGVGQETSEKRLAEEMEAVVERSVADHCKNDPAETLGAFLSGGTDSSTVVGMMDRIGRRPVTAYSIGFEEEVFNELEYAVIAARKFGATHRTGLVGPRDCAAALPSILKAFDEPFANASAIPTYLCARLAAENGTKVLLAGDGGDELFGGNERYRIDRIFGIYHDIPQLVRKGMIEPALAILPGVSVLRKAQSYVRRANIPALDRFFSYHFLCAHNRAEIFEPDFIASLGGYSILDVPAQYYREAPATAHLDRLLYVDVKMTLGDSDLPKVVCAAELAGVGVRFPFLDRDVAEFSGRVPARLKLKGFKKRYLFKRAFRNLLPPEVIRKKKHGFGIPVSSWLKSDPELRQLTWDTLFSARALNRGYFRQAFVEDLFRKYEADDSTYYGDNVWTLLMLELWHRQFVDASTKVTA